MARGLLLFITGMFVVMGIYSLGLQKRIIASDEQLGEAARYKIAQLNARSAAEYGIMQINDSGISGAKPWLTLNFEEGTAIVNADKSGNNYTLTATASYDDVQAQVRIQAETNSGSIFSEVNGAMGIHSNNLEFNVAGSAFSIDGGDYMPDGSINPDGVETAGIAVQNSTLRNIILDALNKNQEGNILGEGGAPSIKDVELELGNLDLLMNQLAGEADQTYTTNHTASGENSLGSPTNPEIVYVKNGTLDVSNATGYGILIIGRDATLDIRGNLDTYEGLVFVQGSAQFVRGNINIYGAMLFGGEDPDLEIDIDLRGNVNIRYSSHVLDELSNIFSAKFQDRLRLTGIYQ